MDQIAGRDVSRLNVYREGITVGRDARNGLDQNTSKIRTEFNFECFDIVLFCFGLGFLSLQFHGSGAHFFGGSFLSLQAF